MAYKTHLVITIQDLGMNVTGMYEPASTDGDGSTIPASFEIEEVRTVRGNDDMTLFLEAMHDRYSAFLQPQHRKQVSVWTEIRGKCLEAIAEMDADRADLDEVMSLRTAA